MSSYAGPIPLPVVPIFLPPAISSLSLSNSLWKGRISETFSAIMRFFFEILIPKFSKESISFFKAQGSKTTPLPIIDILSSLKIPEGSKDNLKILSPVTIV